MVVALASMDAKGGRELAVMLVTLLVCDAKIFSIQAGREAMALDWIE